MFNWTTDDTIASLASAPGLGAIGVIRISGKDAIKIASKIFSGKVQSFQTHTAHYGHILDCQQNILDSVLLLVMKAPKSYTGEDTVEISCHGSPLIIKKVLERIFEAGARPAQPGEFSLRAFLHGKIDLAQAEAVQLLIGAKSEEARSSANKQLKGLLSKKISAHQKELTRIAAILEAWVDFPEEDLAFSPFEEVIENLDAEKEKLQTLANSFQEGKKQHLGLNICLLGAPNVGKSSLLNALLKTDRAIVTEIAGTTRDLLTEDLTIGGLHFKISDTAGIRETQERVEQEGIRRSKEAMQEADLLLLVLDATRDLEKEDLELLEIASKEKTILIWNKTDVSLPKQDLLWETQVHISAKEHIGIENLQKTIESFVWKTKHKSHEEILITSERHYQAIISAIELLKRVIYGLKENVSAEFVSSDLKAALEELGTILGTNVTEDILTSIFSQFCLGK